MTAFSVSYLLSPKFCHRFVGYLEEEAVKTYTQCLKVILFVVLEEAIKNHLCLSIDAYKTWLAHYSYT